VALGAAATASAIEWVTFPSRVIPAPWQPEYLDSKPPLEDKPPVYAKGHVFGLFVGSGYCAGDPEIPRIDHVEVVERPKTKARPFKSAVITAFLFLPEYKAQAVEGEEGPTYATACADLGLTLTKRVRLKRPAKDLVIYDGSYSPPRRVWPPVRRKSTR
jgi:hypothetical protein